MPQTVSLSFYRFSGVSGRLWAFAMMGMARGAIRKTPDIGFWKLCGSGSGEGFTPIPNTAVYAILATWPDEATARERTGNIGIFGRYARRAAEHWTIFLSPSSARGAWSGDAPFVAETSVPAGTPLAALTRATIKPSILAQFWKRVPKISAMIGSDPNVAFKIGIGEVPWFHQVTFSVWPNAASMTEFARSGGPHAAAIRAVRDGDWFREELYARFAITGEAGTWNGASPIAHLFPEDRP